MLKAIDLKALIAAGIFLISHMAHADEIVEGPLIAAGLWEGTKRSMVFEWQEYPNTVKVIHRVTKEVVCERGVQMNGDWIRSSDGALINVVAGASDTGMVTSFLKMYSGDFSRKYIVDDRYEAFGAGLSYSAGRGVADGFPAAVHSRYTATRIGACPADMKPGEMRKIESSP
jgi:hypothetical protein